MIKCSICSYQCDNWYTSNWRFACHINFSLGSRFWACSGLLLVSSPLHNWWRSKPLRETQQQHACMHAWVLFLAPYKTTNNLAHVIKSKCKSSIALDMPEFPPTTGILVEGAIALPVTHGGGVLFASWKLFQFLSSLIVKVILAIFMWALA